MCWFHNQHRYMRYRKSTFYFNHRLDIESPFGKRKTNTILMHGPPSSSLNSSFSSPSCGQKKNQSSIIFCIRQTLIRTTYVQTRSPSMDCGSPSLEFAPAWLRSTFPVHPCECSLHSSSTIKPSHSPSAIKPSL